MLPLFQDEITYESSTSFALGSLINHRTNYNQLLYIIGTFLCLVVMIIWSIGKFFQSKLFLCKKKQ